MLRLAIWYENRLGRNDGNPLYVWNELKRRQAANILEVDHLVPYDKEIHRFGTYDAHIWVDWGEDGLAGILPYAPMYPPGHPLVYWASDTHLGYGYRLKCAKQADHVFCAQKRAVEEFKRDGVEASWLPHAVEPQAYPNFNLLTKHFDVCFVGHINSGNRVDMLDRAFKEIPNFYYGQRLFEDAARKYAESKVCLNISHMDDLNMRTFEVMATGSFLLTNDIPTIHDLFEDGKHLVLYKDLDDMVEKARYYITHDDERENIARAGQAEVLAKHTIKHRVDEILSTISEPAMALGG